MKDRKVQVDVLSEIHARLRHLDRRIVRIANQKWQNVPIYDLPDNPPEENVQGQLALDLNGKLWWFYPDVWQTC